MQGKLNVTYQLVCENDVHKEVSLKEIMQNEKVIKLLKSEYAKGLRNLDISTDNTNTNIILKSQKELYEFEADKKDFADLIELAEENAKERKLFKKGYQEIALVDFVTID
ncbi:MAG: Unknown protein [uncultured Sulfurovum sp.]|uniref:Uncharacterized protein n=1 Tax=uncultured Sulfurovum sp. TaxID=269237 RepID=A0A6S6SD93_9BACT|nr:MAG: Unknown protein [uncultured Sulfurovum sp.]